METPPTEDSQLTPNSSDVAVTQIDQDNFAHQLSDSVNGGDESDQKLSAEDVKGVLEIIASTGKFWHDWNELKNMLLFQLKQVLSEYPEARKSDDQQNSSLGESYLQLLRSLEEALYSFIEGPPFTLQRLCEILLNAQTIYPNLSKLALALEKNLLVTSTITKCTDSYPQTVEVTDASMEFVDAEPLIQSHPHDQSQPEPLTEAHYLSQHLESLPQPHRQSQPEPQTHHQSQPEPQPHHQSQPEPQPHHQSQTEPQPHHHSQPEPQPQPHPESQPQPQQEPQPHHQSQPDPQHHNQSELEPQPHHSQALDESQPQPQIQIQPECPLPPHSNLEENGGEPMTCDRDEVMSEVDAEVDDGMTIDMETFEEIISTSESTNPQSNNSQS